MISESSLVWESPSSEEPRFSSEALSGLALSEESLPSAITKEIDTRTAEPNNFERIQSEILNLPGITRVELCGQGAEGTTLLLTTNTGAQKAGKLVPVTRFFDFASSKIELKEAEILSKVHHPCIAKFDETIEICNGSYLLMVRDYVPGHSLQDILASQGKLDAVEAEKILRQLLEVLGYLHDPNAHPQIEAQIVHRDIKPGNIIVNDQGHVTLVDFGSSHLRGDGYASLTVDARGSIGYMPYEQYSGQATPAGDLYALGVTITECLIGKMGDSLKKNAFSREAFQLPKNLAISDRLRAALQVMIEPQIENRPQSVKEVLDLLDGKAEIGSNLSSKSYLESVHEWLYSWVEYASGVLQEKKKNLHDYAEYRDWLSEGVRNEGIVYSSQYEKFDVMIRRLYECGLRAHISSSELELETSRLRSEYRRTSETVVSKILDEMRKLEGTDWTFQVIERYQNRAKLLATIEQQFEGIVSPKDSAAIHSVGKRMDIELQIKAYRRELESIQSRNFSSNPDEIPAVRMKLDFLKHISETEKDTRTLARVESAQTELIKQTEGAIQVFQDQLAAYSQHGSMLPEYLNERRALIKFGDAQHIPIDEALIKSLDKQMVNNLTPKIGGLLGFAVSESQKIFSELESLLENKELFHGKVDSERIKKAERAQADLLFIASLVDRMLEIAECTVTIASTSWQSGECASLYVESSDLKGSRELHQFINLKTMKNWSGRTTIEHLAQFASERSYGENMNFPAVTEEGTFTRGRYDGFESGCRQSAKNIASSLVYFFEEGRDGNSNIISLRYANELAEKLRTILSSPTITGLSKIEILREAVDI